MSARLPYPDEVRTVADLLHRLGDIPPDRVLFDPPPGTATMEDLLEIDRKRGIVPELVDGTLVEKAMGFLDERVGVILGYLIEAYLEEHDLGITNGAAARVQILPGIVRGPDVAFFSWKRLPNRELPADAIPGLIPDLAVEVLSPGNTLAEMSRKRREYFKAGVRLVWEINPEKRTAKVYTAAERWIDIDSKGTLDGDKVLPGFVLPLSRLFARAGRRRKR